MAILKALAALGLVVAAGCYDPSTKDCVVTCSGSSECASGETCGSDGYCAAPDVAGTCAARIGADAGPPAPGMVTIHIMIMGKGNVALSPQMMCDAPGPQNGDCTFSVPSHAAVMLTAMVTSLKDPFSGWSGGTCTGANFICSFTPTADVTVGAAFK